MGLPMGERVSSAKPGTAAHSRVCEGSVLLADKTCAPTRQARGGRSLETLLHLAKQLQIMIESICS